MRTSYGFICSVSVFCSLLLWANGHGGEDEIDWSQNELGDQNMIGPEDMVPEVEKRTDEGMQVPETHYINLTMPGIHPTKIDDYQCVSFRLNDNPNMKTDSYIINFKALASADRTHHMILFGCKYPYRVKGPWQCGPICSGPPTIIFAWAKNAPPPIIPPDVGFGIGGNTGINYLVLQIHYTGPIPASLPGDTSGLQLTVTNMRTTYLAGIFILLRYNLRIPPHAPKIVADISCNYTGNTVLYPFAFRTHAHGLSTVISGYMNNGTWKELGKGNPQWPQAFYPMKHKMILRPGNLLAARCVYDATNSDSTKHIGATHNDEMCNFYFMYYTDAKAGKSFYQCAGDDYPYVKTQLPADSDQPLPSNALLEGKASAAIHEVNHWPLITDADSLTLGQIGGIDTDSKGNVHVFHRGVRNWEVDSFDTKNQFTMVDDGPLNENCVVSFSPAGKVLKQWGKDLFYLPHGIHVDRENNIWLTDVAMHQVFKFKPGKLEPELTLGVKFEPGTDDKHFCKPAAVATLSTGEFLVADGYCNSRILKFAADGTLLNKWGTRSINVGVDGFPPGGSFDIPHSLTILEDRKWVCVADRENGRIQCFDYVYGKFIKQIHPDEFNGRLFAVTYNEKSGFLYAVNGPDLYGRNYPVLGFVLSPETGKLLMTFEPKLPFTSPHDLTISEDGMMGYVGQIEVTDPRRVIKFVMGDVQKLMDQNRVPVKKNRPLMGHPITMDTGKDQEGGVKTEADIKDDDLGPSMIIGGLLVIPILIIIIVTVFMRLRRTGPFAKSTIAHNSEYVKAVLLEADSDTD